MKNLLCMALSLCVLHPAGAQSLSPALSASVQFGSHSTPQWHWRAAATQVVYSGRTALAVPVIAVDFDAARAPSASLLGVPLAATTPVSNLDGGQQQSGTSWVWIGVGLGAVIAVAVAASSGSSETNENRASNNGCSTVGGDVIGPNSPPSVDPTCGTSVSANGGS